MKNARDNRQRIMHTYVICRCHLLPSTLHHLSCLHISGHSRPQSHPSVVVFSNQLECLRVDKKFFSRETKRSETDYSFARFYTLIIDRCDDALDPFCPASPHTCILTFLILYIFEMRAKRSSNNSNLSIYIILQTS